jgi:hypothetical protein
MSRSIFNTGINKAPAELSYSTQPQSVEVEVSRNPASQYLVLDSRNRIQSATPGGISNEAWNDFRLQRPQSIMESFATRIGVSEIRFPWFIPNITKRNNTLLYFGYIGGEVYSEPITIPYGFYTPDELVTKINELFTAEAYDYSLTLSYFDGQYTFTPVNNVTPGDPIPFEFAPFIVFEIQAENDPGNIPDENTYYNNPSLCLTLGMPYENVGYGAGGTGPFSGNYTETLYTQYVDLISNKFNQYTTNLDGNSYSQGSNRLLARIYLADEVSVGNNYDELYQPHIIHRQFKNPKMVMWNKDAVIDWLDIQVRDQYNQLVPLPSLIQVGGPSPPPPSTGLTTYAVTTFLVNGPIFNQPYTQALNFYINCDAIGGTLNPDGSVTGSQTFGSFYLGTAGAIPPSGYPFPGPWNGLCFSDFNGVANGPQSYNYLNPLRTQKSKVLTSLGGFYMDVRGLFSTSAYSIPAYPGGAQPTAIQVAQSLCATLYDGTSSPNPLGWSNAQWGGVRFDGLNLDFENIGLGGNPNVSNTYPPLPATAPSFPADATDPQYSSYMQGIVDLITTIHTNAPNKILTHAPLSLSINGSSLLTPNGGAFVAVTTALNTWFAFPTYSTIPTTTSYNATASLAMNHPSQLKYFDDIFVQFYNSEPDVYLGGTFFPMVLAQWGFVALKAQNLGIKNPKINIGLAKGVIQGSTANPSVPNSQGVTASLPGPIPSTYWYPQYKTASPPNPNATSPAGNTFPDIGINVDAENLKDALNTANTILQGSGLPGASTLQISDWCSGAGWWAGGPATQQASQVYSEVPNLPKGISTVWCDAMYPSPDPQWTGNVPIVPGLTKGQKALKKLRDRLGYKLGETIPSVPASYPDFQITLLATEN